MKHRTLKALAVLATLATLVAPQLSAQQRGGYLARKGFWIGLGGGFGSLGVSCSLCTTDRENGGSGSLRLGGTVSPRLRVGVESNGFTKSESGVDVLAGQLGVVGNYYPAATGNLYVRGSVGASIISFKGDFDGDGVEDELDATGIGIALGLGYDLFVSRSVSLSPFFNYLVALSGDAQFNSQSLGETLKPNLWQVGLAVVIH